MDDLDCFGTVMGKPKTYARLPGTGTASFCRHTLWASKDHLLLVSRSFVAEDYLRFDFSDIEGIVIARTPAWIVQAILCAIFAAVPLSFFTSAISRQDPVRIGVWGVVSIPALFLILYVVFLGPTCDVWLRTASGAHKVPSLQRVRTARKALAKIQPLVEGAQGRLAQETLRQNASFLSPYQDPSFGPAEALPSTVKGYDGSVHRHYFMFLLAISILSPLFLYFQNLLTTVVGGFIFIAAFILMVICLARQDSRNTPHMARMAVWGNLALTIAGLLIGSAYGMFYFFQTIPERIAAGGSASVPFEMRMVDHPFLLATSIVETAITVILAAAGLLSFRNFAKSGRSRGASR